MHAWTLLPPKSAMIGRWFCARCRVTVESAGATPSEQCAAKWGSFLLKKRSARPKCVGE